MASAAAAREPRHYHFPPSTPSHTLVLVLRFYLFIRYTMGSMLFSLVRGELSIVFGVAKLRLLLPLPLPPWFGLGNLIRQTDNSHVSIDNWDIVLKAHRKWKLGTEFSQVEHGVQTARIDGANVLAVERWNYLSSLSRCAEWQKSREMVECGKGIMLCFKFILNSHKFINL